MTDSPTVLPVSGEIEIVIRALAGRQRSTNETDKQHEAFIKHMRPVYEKDAQAVLAALRSHPQARASGEISGELVEIAARATCANERMVFHCSTPAWEDLSEGRRDMHRRFARAALLASPSQPASGGK